MSTFNPTTESLADVRSWMRAKRPAFRKHVVFDLTPVYLVMRDFGSSDYEAVCHPEKSLRNIVEEIATGEIDRVVTVLEIFEGRSVDITDSVRATVEAMREAA